MAGQATTRSVLALLGTAVAGSLAGCSVFDDHLGLLVFNHRTDPVTASISMRRVGDDVEVFSGTFRLAAEEDARRQVDLTADAHRITTGVEGCCIEVHVRDDAIEYRVRTY